MQTGCATSSVLLSKRGQYADWLCRQWCTAERGQCQCRLCRQKRSVEPASVQIGWAVLEYQFIFGPSSEIQLPSPVNLQHIGGHSCFPSNYGVIRFAFFLMLHVSLRCRGEFPCRGSSCCCCCNCGFCY